MLSIRLSGNADSKEASPLHDTQTSHAKTMRTSSTVNVYVITHVSVSSLAAILLAILAL